MNNNSKEKGEVTRGRPIKKDKYELEYEDEGYIATNPFALELLQLISEMAIYKILTITGPSKSKNIKNRKEIEKEQKRIRQNLSMQEEKTFFLRNQEVMPRKYKMVDNRIVECEQSKIILFDDLQINQGELFISSIKCVFKELNEETQYFLQLLIKIYLETGNSLEQFEEQFFETFKQNSHTQYKEIQQWNELYEISFDEKLSEMQKKINQILNKFDLKENQSESQKKVEQKRINALKYQKQKLQQFQSIEKPNRPLKIFIKKIYNLFQAFSYIIKQ